MKRTTTTIALLGALACLLVLASSHAGRPAAALGPAVLATVDLGRVFDECHWRARAETELEARAEAHQKQVDERRAQVDLRRQDLELLVTGTDQYRNAEREYKKAAVEYQAITDFSRAKVESMRTASRKEIFQKIATAAEAYAKANGIDIVITDDSAAQLFEGSDRQLVQQLLLRRVVYASPEHDVTEDLIAWINEQ